jgi:hypothetical protein
MPDDSDLLCGLLRTQRARRRVTLPDFVGHRGSMGTRREPGSRRSAIVPRMITDATAVEKRSGIVRNDASCALQRLFDFILRRG